MVYIGLREIPNSEFEMNYTTFFAKIQHLSRIFSLPNLPYLFQKLPVFAIHGSQIRILSKPQDFYNELLSQASNAKKRIIIASLYVGNGTLENKLVSCISDQLESQPNLRVRWLVDYTRASRGEVNTRTLLLPLIKRNESTCKVSLFHTPVLRGLLKMILPERWNEIIGLQHMKIYVYDDSVVISGANLSNDYFVNRQDRYLVVRDCPDLADFYEDLVSTVASHSFQLKPDNTTHLDAQCPTHPYEGNFTKYCQEFNSSIQTFWRSQLRKSECRLSSLAKDEMEENTLLFPTIQMSHFGICTDSEVTSNLLESIPSNSSIHLATGYFNLTNQYVHSILHRSSAHYKILCAHPTANGFLGARGFAGGIPAAYTNLCKQFYQKVLKYLVSKRIRIYEYEKEDWTFHAKGLWYYPPSDVTPSSTLIGSPNFGYRSVHRDLETHLLVSTTCPTLRHEMEHEQNKLYESSKRVSNKTFEAQDRIVPLWVKLVTYIMKFYF